MLTKNTTALFDLDGVILDTESQYSAFWKKIGEEMELPVPNFDMVIKGTTLPNILSQYFSDYSQNDIDYILEQLDVHEKNMVYDEIPGALSFVKILKEKGIKIGLVTSSMDEKLDRVNEELHLNALFDTIVSGSRIKKGKPNPDCYLLAAQDLDAKASECVVFEDALTGIAAGVAARMKVVGLSTTLPAKDLLDKCVLVIPDFKTITYQNLLDI